MSITLEAHGRVLAVQLSGQLESDDYDQFAPEVDRLIREYGKIRMVVLLDDFHGWTAGGFWEDAKFSVRHYSGIERLAIVGNEFWEQAMTAICKPLTASSVRYFDHEQTAEAAAWIRIGIPSMTEVVS